MIPTVLSCRAAILLPDDVTSARWHTERFGPLAQLRYDGMWGLPNPAEFPTEIIGVISGYNVDSNPGEWSDSAMNGAHEIDSRLTSYGCQIPRIPMLWPTGGSTLGSTLAFAAARRRAKEAAIQYFAPFIKRLIESGVKVHLIGHSCGGAEVVWIAQALQEWGLHLDLAVLMNAAIRVSEIDPSTLAGANRWLCFHDRRDSALRLMQRDFVDEHGGFWKGLLAALPGGPKNDRDEPIVGMVGLPATANVENIDLTSLTKGKHSAARCIPPLNGQPGVLERVAMELAK